MKIELFKIFKIKWVDGFEDTFEVDYFVNGGNILRLKLTDGSNIQIPLCNVRYFTLFK